MSTYRKTFVPHSEVLRRLDAEAPLRFRLQAKWRVFYARHRSDLQKVVLAVWLIFEAWLIFWPA